MLEAYLGKLVIVIHQNIICSKTGTLRVNSIYNVTVRLISQLLDSLSIPATKPIIVAVKMPNIAITRVFKSPTRRALP